MVREATARRDRIAPGVPAELSRQCAEPAFWEQLVGKVVKGVEEAAGPLFLAGVSVAGGGWEHVGGSHGGLTCWLGHSAVSSAYVAGLGAWD